MLVYAFHFPLVVAFHFLARELLLVGFVGLFFAATGAFFVFGAALLDAASYAFWELF